MKKIIIALIFAGLALACTEEKSSKQNEKIEIKGDSLSNERFQIDLLSSQVKKEMMRFGKIIEQEIFELKLQKEKLNGQQKIDLQKSIEDLQRNKDSFNKKLAELNPSSGEDQSEILKELDSITTQIQSQIREIRGIY